MIEGLASLTACVAFVLGGVHAYWVLGGRRGLMIAVPAKAAAGAGEEPLFRPTRTATAVVALLLAAMGIFVLQLGGIAEPWLPRWFYPIGGWLLAAVFALRAVGDFPVAGLF
ncbi:DUF3995 domain-containing protein [Paenibacillus soyae]|uniref:DUF3995 domain-containing protein n=1 Tax=Paenibacillus soyae TaxID=2969249 RepID=A0A9X2S867_9BACL|nr:DUF3995 domain-containing protein [Paenibacillus soyae]MCR2804034.1 DUF3995 domain-containing protein [Paenibacillus soyae]